MAAPSDPSSQPLRIAVVGAGVTGLSAAWLLGARHDVTLYEAEPRLGGHSNTVEAPSPSGPIAVDTGFIVYNEPNYPNLTALLAHLGAPSRPAQMSFGVSLDDGAFEYATHGLGSLFAQKRNLANPRFIAMLRDLRRFHRTALDDLPELERSMMSLGDYLDLRGYGAAFRDAHLLPQAAAIWSSSLSQMTAFPAAAFLRFYRNHRLLTVDTRPTWRTVEGGSRVYVKALTDRFAGRVAAGAAVVSVRRTPDETLVLTADGSVARYDQVVLAVHADQALRLLETPSDEERRLLGDIRYRPNRAVLHRDTRLMPRRRAAWAAWNHLGLSEGGGEGGVTYWMNLLQGLPGPPLFVSLNPLNAPRPDTVLGEFDYEHPVFDAAAMLAQREVWSLQGRQRTWFCGAWCGYGFHEDGLQAGLAVAEQLGGVRRPWTVADESGRIHLAPSTGRAERAA